MRTAVLAVLALASSLVTGCEPHRAPRADVGISRIPTTYSYVLTASCGERSLIGRFRIDVRDDAVVAAEPLGRTRIGGLQLRDFPTLAGLVGLANGAESDAVVDLRTDPSGLPTHLSIDHDPAAIDDEECYDVGRIRRLHD